MLGLSVAEDNEQRTGGKMMKTVADVLATCTEKLIILHFKAKQGPAKSPHLQGLGPSECHLSHILGRLILW